MSTLLSIPLSKAEWELCIEALVLYQSHPDNRKQAEFIDKTIQVIENELEKETN